MRGLLTLPVRSVGGCCITTAALAVIIAVAAGYGALVAHASFVVGCLLFVFWGLLFACLALGHFTGALDLSRPQEGSAHVDH